MFEEARALDSVMRSSESYSFPQSFNVATALSETTFLEPSQSDSNSSPSTLAARDPKCFFCGSAKHPRALCADHARTRDPRIVQSFTSQTSVMTVSTQ